MSSYNPPAPYPVLVHSYLPSISSSAHQSPEQQRPIQTYEHLPADAISNSNWNTLPRAENALIFVGGLGDGPHTIPYVRTLATHLFGSALLPLSSRYSVFEARLSSAFSAFGHASLAQDARELADLVRYLRVTLGKKKVVIMGHSTGCQDCMEYATRFLAEFRGDAEEEMKASVRVDGLILQGPVSDRQAIAMAEDPAEVKACLETAEEMVRQGRATDVIPTEKMPAGWKKVPMTAYRWISLAGVGGDDDYFSSDLSDEKVEAIWGKLSQPVLILPSEKDEWVPKDIDVAGLVDRWKRFCKPGIASDLSGPIPGANHRVEDATAQQWLSRRVAAFLGGVNKRQLASYGF